MPRSSLSFVLMMHIVKFIVHKYVYIYIYVCVCVCFTPFFGPLEIVPCSGGPNCPLSLSLSHWCGRLSSRSGPNNTTCCQQQTSYSRDCCIPLPKTHLLPELGPHLQLCRMAHFFGAYVKPRNLPIVGRGAWVRNLQQTWRSCIFTEPSFSGFIILS